jgi:hypothetical protein
MVLFCEQSGLRRKPANLNETADLIYWLPVGRSVQPEAGEHAGLVCAGPAWSPFKEIHMNPLTKEILRMRSTVRQHIAIRIRELNYSRIHDDWTGISQHQKAADAVVELAACMGILTRTQLNILTNAIYTD